MSVLMKGRLQKKCRRNNSTMPSSFDTIFEIACDRHGRAEIEAQITDASPKPASELANISDDRWLAMMTKCVFQAGFNWRVIDNKWDGFETAFEGFELGRWILSNDDDIATLASDKRIVRNPQKIKSVPENARFIGEIAREHGGFGQWIAESPTTERNLLLEEMNKRGSRLGAMTGQFFLRFMESNDWCAGSIQQLDGRDWVRTYANFKGACQVH